MKVGLFFGTFNPIHIGHLILANTIQQTENLDQVWFVVTPHNPFKEKSNLLADYHRLNMVKIAIDNSPNLRASDVEFSLTQPNYTANTLAKLKEIYPNYTFSLILGEDNLRGFHKWYNYETILKNHVLLVYPRILTEQEILTSEKPVTDPKISEHKNVKLLADLPSMRISSSYIREQIKANKNVQFLLSEAVYNYVDEMNFYKAV